MSSHSFPLFFNAPLLLLILHLYLFSRCLGAWFLAAPIIQQCVLTKERAGESKYENKVTKQTIICDSGHPTTSSRKV